MSAFLSIARTHSADGQRTRELGDIEHTDQPPKAQGRKEMDSSGCRGGWKIASITPNGDVQKVFGYVSLKVKIGDRDTRALQLINDN